MYGIIAQQMGIGFDRTEIIDADHFDILAAGLGNGAKHIAADAAKPVDCNPDCHLAFLLFNSGRHPRGTLTRPRRC